MYVDECTSSISVSDSNANCQNTEGSFLCQCVIGFSGDGKSCTGMKDFGPWSNRCYAFGPDTLLFGAFLQIKGLPELS